MKFTNPFRKRWYVRSSLHAEYVGVNRSIIRIAGHRSWVMSTRFPLIRSKYELRETLGPYDTEEEANSIANSLDPETGYFDKR
jgi:hypothetical protein